MIGINIICIGKLKEKYLADAANEYIKRLKVLCSLKIIELSEEKTANDPSPAQISKTIEEEGKRILEKIPDNSYTIALCIEGKELTSSEFSKKTEDISMRFSTINFVIGGSYGLSDSVKQKSDFKLSMGRMTFPHQLFRVMLLEQIYRAFQISRNTKYHK